MICRQRPGTAKGVCFISLEDETGIANAVVTSPLFEANRPLLVTASALAIDGRLERREGVIHVHADRFHTLATDLASTSHDFR